MKILLIDVNCKQGSTGKIVYDLYTSLNAGGHTAVICYGRGRKLGEKQIFKFGIDLETYFHALMTRITGLTGRYSYFSTRRLLKFMDRFQPDVVHIHELHAYFVNLKPVVEYLKRNRIKTVWTFHCEFMYTGKCGHAYDCDRWKTECKACPAKKDYPASLFFDFTRIMYREKKRMFQGFDRLTITTPSPWLADRVDQSFLKDKEIRVIHNGVDTGIYHPRNGMRLRRSLGIPKDHRVVLAVAPDIMSERKGGRFVLKLARLMRDEKLTFILLGAKQEMENRDSGVNVRVIARMEDENLLAEYYSMSDVFVICSRRETFSMTCAEALCCGTPVAGFCSGAPETVFEKPYAEFVEYGDIEALKSAVKRQLKDADAAKKCFKYGRARFSIEREYENYLSCYLEDSGVRWNCLLRLESSLEAGEWTSS